MLLKRGSRGRKVRELQQKLVNLGYNTNGIDGIFGPGSDRAVRQFQKNNNLIIDGVVGPATMKKLGIEPNNILGYRKIQKHNSNIHIYEVDKTQFIDVDLGKKNKLERTSTIVKNHLKAGKKVAAATNCGFFSWSGKPEHLGMLVAEGLYYNLPHKHFIDFIYYKDRSTEIISLGANDRNKVAELQRTTHWAIGSSYSLVQDGKINLECVEHFDHAKWRNPRTMLGQKKDKTFVLVVVDGRRSNSLGVTAKQSAEIMKYLGCYNAVNLDGGGSSTMVVVRNRKTQVVNRPSDGSERAVGSVLLVLEK